MALNSKRLTNKVAKAFRYFEQLKDKADPHGADIDNVKMLEAASWAASALSSSELMKEQIVEKLRKNGYPVPGTVDFMDAQRYVRQAVINYVQGDRNISSHTAQEAARVCRTLLDYVSILEKERKTKSNK